MTRMLFWLVALFFQESDDLMNSEGFVWPGRLVAFQRLSDDFRRLVASRTSPGRSAVEFLFAIGSARSNLVDWLVELLSG